MLRLIVGFAFALMLGLPRLASAHAPACAVPNAPGQTLRAEVPDTPPSALVYGVGGNVDVLVTLDKRSSVKNATIAHSPDRMFDAPALQAARASSFQTQIVDCLPVGATFLFRVDFRVPPQPPLVNAFALLPGTWMCRHGLRSETEVYARAVSERFVHSVAGVPTEIFSLDDYHLWHLASADGKEFATAVPWLYPVWKFHGPAGEIDFERIDEKTFDRTTIPAAGAGVVLPSLTRCRRI